MNDNFIHIQISKGGAPNQDQNNASQSEVSFAPSNPASSPNDGHISKIKSSAINAALINVGKTALNYGLSNYGALTGDYIGQTRLNDALNAAGMIGTALTGPVGLAVVAGQVAIAGFNRYADVQKSKVISQNMQARVGISIGGSR